MKPFITPLLFSFLFFSTLLIADSDTLPLNKKTKVIKESDSAEITKQLKTGSLKEAQSTVSAEEEIGPKPFLGSISVYGTKKLNEVILKELLGKDFDEWIKKGLAGDPSSLDIEKSLIQKIQKKFNFPFAEFSIVQFFEPDNLAVHIVLDVIEKNDLASRANFYSEPTGQFTDPDLLIQSWMEYENLGMDLIESGQIAPDGTKCEALHCPFGHEHTKLKRYGPLFTEGVKKNSEKLIEILNKDKRADYRASAAFLLAYLPNGKKVVSALVDRIRDPDQVVRNNVLRVLGDISELRPEFAIPVNPLIPALNYPRSTDRSKAVFVVYSLAAHSSSAREELLRDGVPNLLLLLDTKIPDQRDLAYNTLKKVSGKDYPVSDLVSWKNWYGKLKKDKGLPAAK